MLEPVLAAIAGLAAIFTILLALFGAFALWWIYGPRPAVPVDRRTGRVLGDHGTAQQALDWALDEVDDVEQFLRAWRDGTAWEEWPEFYAWLVEERAARHRAPAGAVPLAEPRNERGQARREYFLNPDGDGAP